MNWLERAAAIAKERDEAQAEVERLRGLLRRLEWAAPDCPACGAPGPGTVGPGVDDGHHAPDCWLAAALA